MMILQDTVRVLIADDDFDMRLLVRATLGGDDRIHVVAEAEDGASAIEAHREASPDVCILDYRMPGVSGLDAATTILAEHPDARIVLFSAYLTSDVAEAAAALGVECMRKDQFMDLPNIVVALASTD